MLLSPSLQSGRRVADSGCAGTRRRFDAQEGWQSPETMLNEGATPASDIFALGLICFFVLSGGEHPFGEEKKRTRAMPVCVSRGRHHPFPRITHCSS